MCLEHLHDFLKKSGYKRLKICKYIDEKYEPYMLRCNLTHKHHPHNDFSESYYQLFYKHVENFCNENNFYFVYHYRTDDKKNYIFIQLNEMHACFEEFCYQTCTKSFIVNEQRVWYCKMHESEICLEDSDYENDIF